MKKDRHLTEETFIFTDTTNNTTIKLTLDQVKPYQFHLLELRKNIIAQVETNKIQLPRYHIILSYYQKIRNRELITGNHRFIRNNIEELFNPRYKGDPTKFSHFYFIERYKTKLQSSYGNIYYCFNRIKTNNKVLDTITNVEEYDSVDNEVVLGSFHSHLLVSEIPNEVLTKPNKKLRQLLLQVTGNEYLPANIDDSTLTNLKKSLLETVCRRSELVGNSGAGVKVVTHNANYQYDGFTGWKGMIAYATKQIWNTERMVEVVDGDNSSIILRPTTIPIKEAHKRELLPEDTFKNQ